MQIHVSCPALEIRLAAFDTGVLGYCLADSFRINRRNGISGPTGMYSWSSMFSLASGKDSMMDLASATSQAFRRKTPPLPSSREYHSRRSEERRVGKDGRFWVVR